MADGSIPGGRVAPAASARGNAGMGWLLRRVSDPAFQARAARIPVLRRFVRREGAEMFSLVSGFVQSQVLFALVDLDVLPRLAEARRTPEALAETCGLTADRMALLLQAGAALKLLRRHRDGRFGLARRGAAMMGVPGLAALIEHHRVFYRDLADPVAVLRGQADTELARFWPYVLGADAAQDAAVAERYTGLMADSQTLVAQDTLVQVDLAGTRQLMDVGGGSGAFALAAAKANPALTVIVFDLPNVVTQKAARMMAAGLQGRLRFASGSFRDDPLPPGADAISLVRVLYDHSDKTVAALLAKVYAALPPGGRLVISEPMGGGDRPEPAGDVYFAFYTLAMRTGRARAPDEIAGLVRAAGFVDVHSPAPLRPYVTRVLTAVKPA